MDKNFCSIVNCQFENEYKQFIGKYITNEEFYGLKFEVDQKQYCIFHAPMEAALNTSIEKYKILNKQTKHEILGNFYDYDETSEIFKNELQRKFYDSIYYIIDFISQKYNNFIRYNKIEYLESKRLKKIQQFITNLKFDSINFNFVIFPRGLIINKKKLKNDFLIPTLFLRSSEINSGFEISDVKIIGIHIEDTRFIGFQFIISNLDLKKHITSDVLCCYLGDIKIINSNFSFCTEINIINNRINTFKGININTEKTIGINTENATKILRFKFDNNVVEGLCDFSFKNTKNLRNISIQNNAFGYQKALNSYEYANGEFNLEDNIIDTDIYFEHSIFCKAPNFFNTDFKKNIFFQGCAFLDNSRESYNKYSYLKELMRKKRMDIEEKNFWNLEENAKINYHIKISDLRGKTEFIKLMLTRILFIFVDLIPFCDRKKIVSILQKNNKNEKDEIEITRQNLVSKSKYLYVIDNNSQCTENFCSKFYDYCSKRGKDFNRMFVFMMLTLSSIILFSKAD